MRALSSMVVGFALGLCSVATQVVAGQQDFTIVNATGYQINEVYVSPSSSDDWLEDVMDRDVLPNGESVDIEFDRGEDQCKWDLKVTYDDGDEAEWTGFDLCSVSKITLKYSRKTGETWATYE